MVLITRCASKIILW